MHKLYNDYSSWLKTIFNERVQKISVNAGFTCPNRDGVKGIGGCIYCDNNTFSPAYCSSKKSITQQLNEGIEFFKKKYQTQKYIAYFQPYSNSYANLDILKKYYYEACNHSDIVGIAISTRPDCINESILSLISEISKKYFVTLEFGVESTLNSTLKFLNRCHTFEDSENAIKMASEYGIRVGVHLIIGLPNESKEQILNHAKVISKLPVDIIKIHQLQIIKGTKLEVYYNNANYNITTYNIDEYIDIVIGFIEHLNPKIIIERFTSESPLNKIVAPNWNGLKNFEIVEKIRKGMIELNTWQGKCFNESLI